MDLKGSRVLGNKSNKLGLRDVDGEVRSVIVPMKRVTTVEERTLGKIKSE